MRETIQFFQHEPARRSSGQVGIKRRKATCNEVCVYKVNHTCFLREKFFCKGGLARTIGARDHNATRGFRGLLSHVSITKTRIPSSWHSKLNKLSVFEAEKERESLKRPHLCLAIWETIILFLLHPHLNPLPSRERKVYEEDAHEFG